MCPSCGGALLVQVKAVPYCGDCDQKNGVKRPAESAVRAHLRCPRCEHKTVVLKPAVKP